MRTSVSACTFEHFVRLAWVTDPRRRSSDRTFGETTVKVGPPKAYRWKKGHAEIPAVSASAH